MAIRTSSPISKNEARAELAKRELARRSILRFGQYVMPHFKLYPHQRMIEASLLKVVEYVNTRGQSGIGRLMIETQPQVGKSLLASNLFPAWCLGNHPDWNFILTSYNDARAQGNSKAVRDLVNHPAYRAVFGDLAGKDVALSSDSRSASEWSLAAPNRGGVMAAGVGGGITGRPANIILIDDPFKSREEAESQTRRDLVDDWYESQVYSRQQEGMAIILFHTRWNPDDLAGRKIKAMVSNPRADKWEILMMPALALEEDEYPKTEEEQRQRMMDGVFVPMADPLTRKPGEALCPEMLSQETLESIRENMSPLNFMSLYQQMPFSRSGGKFQRKWFTTAESLPEDRFVFSLWHWDKAATAGAGDYSAGALMALTASGQVWVLDAVRGQWSSYERDMHMRASYQAALVRFPALPVPVLWHQQDPGSAGKDSAQATNKTLAPIPAHFETVTGDKETRAEPWSSALEADNVRLLVGNWNKPYIDEHVSFPRGRNDDWVDCSSSAYNKLLALAGRKRESKIL